VLEVDGEGSLVLDGAGGELLAYAAAPQVHVLGSAAFPRASGDVALAGQAFALRGDSAQLAGDFWVGAASGQGPSRTVRFDGDVRSFSVDGRVVPLAPTPDGSVALAAAAALGLASPLLLRLLAPLYARIPPSEALSSEVRRRLYERVRADPGLSLSDLAQRMGLSWGNTVHHLGVLRRSGLVVSLRHGRYRRWFVAGQEPGERAQVAALRNATSARVAKAVLESPGLSQKQLADRLGMTPQAVHWHLVRLAGAGLVRRVRDGRQVRHFVAQAKPLPVAASLR
jgi:DNA-binding transcriptional ArsR family regulator